MPWRSLFHGRLPTILRLGRGGKSVTLGLKCPGPPGGSDAPHQARPRPGGVQGFPSCDRRRGSRGTAPQPPRPAAPENHAHMENPREKYEELCVHEREYACCACCAAW